jgi:hypothetical protein
MDPLPGEVLRALRDARNRNLKPERRQTRLDDSRFYLARYERNIGAWSASLDERMEALGVESLDRDNPLQVAAFYSRLDKKALDKQRIRAWAIAIAHMEIERLTGEIARAA